jgi:hypothetical protein
VPEFSEPDGLFPVQQREKKELSLGEMKALDLTGENSKIGLWNMKKEDAA